MVTVNKKIVNSMAITIDNIEQLQKMIDFYRVDIAGPAYLRTRYFSGTGNGLGEIDFQINRKIMVTALESQMNQLCLSLEDNFGVTYDPDD
jgi:hypothetical protein